MISRLVLNLRSLRANVNNSVGSHGSGGKIIAPVGNRGHQNIDLLDANLNNQNKRFFDTFFTTLEEPASRYSNYTHRSQSANSDGTHIDDADAEPRSRNNDAIPLQTIKTATRSGFGSL